MRATVGDRVVVAAGVVGGTVRDGVVVGCPHDDGTPPYRVRWSDTGEESLVFPGTDTLVQPGDDAGTEVRPQDRPTARSVTWQVRLNLVEAAGSTTAEATLIAGPADPDDVGDVRAVGHARKDPGDTEVSLIGDEVAAGRALLRLAEVLLGQAEQDISSQTGHRAHVHP